MHFGTENYLDFAILVNCYDDNYSQGYGQIKEIFRALTRDDILKPYKSDENFRFSNDDNDIGYNLYVFDTKYQKKLETAQPKKNRN